MLRLPPFDNFAGEIHYFALTFDQLSGNVGLIAKFPGETEIPLCQEPKGRPQVRPSNPKLPPPERPVRRRRASCGPRWVGGWVMVTLGPSDAPGSMVRSSGVPYITLSVHWKSGVKKTPCFAVNNRLDCSTTK